MASWSRGSKRDIKRYDVPIKELLTSENMMSGFAPNTLKPLTELTLWSIELFHHSLPGRSDRKLKYFIPQI
ncbi:hypothetical protein RRG08_037862 [Elysia crispata]|uniref:Uncharacterized protein n=1 Tax=Elysia crispata TaxID=231223 RepID=A0AAE1DHA7_9GAST|nr:hypothetical protein RRG08_037862 [Elysia crispata]